LSRGGAGALLELLRRNADYRRLFLATLVSFMGDWFAFVAVSGFVTESTGQGSLAAVVYAATVIPVFFFAPLAGIVADRVDRKKMLVAVDFARIVPALLLVPALWLNLPWVAIALVAILAALSAFFEPVTAAVLPNVVERDDLSLAQTALGATWGTMLFVGAALGGLVASTLGREASFVLNAATFLASGLLVLRIRRPLQNKLHASALSLFAHLHEVWTLARSSEVTRALLVAKGGVGLANGIVGLLPAYATTRFGTGDGGVGILLAARGLGAVMGPFVAHSLVRGDGRRLFLVCGGSMVAYGLAYLLLPFSPSLWLAAGCVVLAHLGGGAQWVLSTFGLQVTTPDGLRGRVMTIDFGLATLAIGGSSLAAGGAAASFGLEVASWGMAVVAIVYGLLWLGWTRRLWLGGPDPLIAASPQR
jgi:MFS family permease